MYSGPGISASFNQANYSGPAEFTPALRSINKIGEEFAVGTFAFKADKAGLGPFFGVGKERLGSIGVVGAGSNLNISTQAQSLGDGNFERNLQVGVVQNTLDGNPTPPCLQVSVPGFWRLRWSVRAGPRAVYVNAKQLTSFTSASIMSYRPSMVVKANPLVGLYNDVSGSAPTGSGWVTIGPVTFTATSTGAVWVELHNNNTNEYNSPALFDHVIAT